MKPQVIIILSALCFNASFADTFRHDSPTVNTNFNWDNGLWNVNGTVQTVAAPPTASDDVYVTMIPGNGNNGRSWIQFGGATNASIDANNLYIQGHSIEGQNLNLSINVVNDFTFSTKNGWITNAQNNNVQGVTKITVGGNFSISDTALTTPSYMTICLERKMTTYANPAIEVGKVLNIENFEMRLIGQSNDRDVTTVIKAGGLSSSLGGGISTSSTSKAIKEVKLLLQSENFQGGDFKGALFTNIANETDRSGFLIDMNDTGGSGKTQTMRLASVYGEQASIVPAAYVDAIVNNGRLDISTTADTALRNITLAGAGTFGVAGSYSGDSTGSLKAESLTWTSGTTLHFDLNAYTLECDTLVLDSLVFDPSDPSDAKYNLLFDFIGDLNLDDSYSIVFKTSGTFSESDINRLTGKTSNNLYSAVFSGAETDAITVSFQQIPEASEAAVLFGAIALALAARRKRK